MDTIRVWRIFGYDYGHEHGVKVHERQIKRSERTENSFKKSLFRLLLAWIAGLLAYHTMCLLTTHVILYIFGARTLLNDWSENTQRECWLVKVFGGANQNTEYIHDSQWEGFIFLSTNQKAQRGPRILPCIDHLPTETHLPTFLTHQSPHMPPPVVSKTYLSVDVNYSTISTGIIPHGVITQLACIIGWQRYHLSTQTHLHASLTPHRIRRITFV